MRRPWLVILALVGLVATACSSDSPTSGAPAQDATSTSAATSVPQVEQRIVYVSDDLAMFTPSRTFLAHLQFFDQFAPPHGIWSVDSRYIVSSGREAVDGVLRRGPNRVWLVDITGESAPLALAEGSLGFFVPAGAS